MLRLFADGKVLDLEQKHVVMGSKGGIAELPYIRHVTNNLNRTLEICRAE